MFLYQSDVVSVLKQFGLDANDYKVVSFGSGLVNKTWKIASKNSTSILQQINQVVFKNPQAIADNIEKINIYLKQTASDYLFVAALPAVSGDFLVQTDDGEFFRLMPLIAGSHSIDSVHQPQQAFEAAKQFGKFTRLLKDFDPAELQHTLPDFHNLTLRFAQYEQALKNADPERIYQAKTAIEMAFSNKIIEEIYRQLVQTGNIPFRVVHHDTKINNVLFDDNERGLCVIDLDTIMPGFYLSDAGDMLRTYLSPANEEEPDLRKIEIREAYFKAIYQGYMQEVGDVVTSVEKKLFIYSGKMMIYMQSLRFLTDFLNGDVYYHTTFTGQNLMRANNQFELLRRFQQTESRLLQLMD